MDKVSRALDDVANKGDRNNGQAIVLADEVVRLKARLVELEAKSVRHAEEIDEWKEASGIVTGSRDPADVTPRMASSYWNDIDRDLTKSQILVEELQSDLRMAKVGDEVGHKLLDISIDDGADKVGELISLRARVAELEKSLVTALDEREGYRQHLLATRVVIEQKSARIAELEARLSRRNERVKTLQKCQDRLRELDKVAQSGEGGSDG